MSQSNKPEAGFETDLVSLRAFVAVVEEGGFSAAARRIYRTQSAVSLQIAKLEERLGCKLLERSTRAVALTDPGEKFLSYARRIVELADEGALAVTSPDDARLLRVGFAEYLAPQHLHMLLARFRNAHPNCDLSLVLGLGSEMLQSMNDGELDLVIAGPESHDGEVLWEEQLEWTAATENIEDSEAPIELIAFPSPCSYRQIAFDALTSASRSWKISIEANSVQAIQLSVKAGLGVSVLPTSAILDGMKVVNNLPPLPNTSVISYCTGDHSNPYAQRFIDYLVSCLSDTTTA